jgi:hypothetical protein
MGASRDDGKHHRRGTTMTTTRVTSTAYAVRIVATYNNKVTLLSMEVSTYGSSGRRTMGRYKTGLTKY